MPLSSLYNSVFAVKSFTELVQFIFKIPGVKFFLSERICQDPLENFFGCQRQRGRTGENPNVQQFCKNSQALRVINSVCASVVKGNCRGRKQPIALKENKPLPKRHRTRKAPSAKKNEKLSSVDNSVTFLQVDNDQSDFLRSDEDCLDMLQPDNDHSDLLQQDNDHSDLLQPDNDHSDLLQSDDDRSDSDDDYSDTDENYLDLLQPNDDCSANHSDPDNDSSNSLSDSDHDHSNFQGQDDNKLMLVDDKIIYLDDSNIDVLPAQFNDGELQVLKLHDVDNDDVQEHAVRKALGPGKADEVMVRGYGIVMHRQDMWTLSDCAWLNDQVRIHVMCINDAWLQYYYYTGDQLLYGFVNGKF